MLDVSDIKSPVPLLDVRNLTKDFAIRRRRLFDSKPIPSSKPAVDDVSFSLEAGGSLGLIGQSGSGKTTLIRAILRLIEPTDGRAWFDGTDIRQLTRQELRQTLRKQMRLVFQHPDAALNPGCTIRQLLDSALRLHTDLDEPERNERNRTLLSQVGLDESYLNKYPHELSGGEKRRIGLVRALATNPRLIFLDEPVSGLDVTLQHRMLYLLKSLQNRYGFAMLVVSHNLNVVRVLCNRVGVMYEGRLIEMGKTSDILTERAEHPYTRKLIASHISLAESSVNSYFPNPEQQTQIHRTPHEG